MPGRLQARLSDRQYARNPDQIYLPPGRWSAAMNEAKAISLDEIVFVPVTNRSPSSALPASALIEISSASTAAAR
jgi:hypothetical protein